MSDLEPLHPDAIGFTLFRIMPNGTCRNYTAIEFVRGWAGAEQFLRQLRACGYVEPSSTRAGATGVLDVLNWDGDIIQDYEVPTPAAFAYIKRKLNLRVERVPVRA